MGGMMKVDRTEEKLHDVTQNRDGGTRGRRSAELETEGMERALSLFRFGVSWHRALPLSKPPFLNT